jgi:hypothetical protein
MDTGTAIRRVFEKARELKSPAEQAPKPTTTRKQPATPPLAPRELLTVWRSCIPNLPCAKTSEVQFDIVPQTSGHEGAVSNAVKSA